MAELLDACNCMFTIPKLSGDCLEENYSIIIIIITQPVTRHISLAKTTNRRLHVAACVVVIVAAKKYKMKMSEVMCRPDWLMD